MKLYRIQHPAHWGGAWYNEDGTSNRLIDSLTDKRLAELPMDSDPEQYRKDGKIWQCAAWDVDHLKHWFTPEDLAELAKLGYMIVSFDAAEYERMPNQVNFVRDSASGFRFYKTYEDLDAGDETYTLPSAFAKEWTTALRSGQYEQTDGMLYDGNGFCCLGVACAIKGADLSELQNVDLISLEGFITKPKFYDTIPVQLRSSVAVGLIADLVDMNDSDGITFLGIADWIEEKVTFVE